TYVVKNEVVKKVVIDVVNEVVKEVVNEVVINVVVMLDQQVCDGVQLVVLSLHLDSQLPLPT
ncbi:hypothetical protein Tco_0903052, partial [Tanacetum coccineum]